MSDKPLVLIRAAEYDSSMEAVVEEAFERLAPEVAGKRVLVKPNLLSARAPEKGVTTHPSVVVAVIAALERRRAAEIIVGDNSGMTGYGDNDRVAAKTGVLDAARKYYRNLGTRPVRIELHNPYAPEVTISGEVLDCDVLVSLPKFKTHTLTTITCAVKNSYGFLLGAEKARLHRAARSRLAFARTVVDVWSLRKPDLVICDAVTAMQGNGPSSRDVFHYGHVIAAQDSVALDATVSRLMCFRDGDVLTTVDAAKRGFGRSLPEEIDIDGPWNPIVGFKPPVTLARTRLAGFLAGLAGSLVVSQPHVDANACVRCGLCRDHCPTQAIGLSPFPAITRSACIRCYCCLEFCPHEAMKLSRRVQFFRKLAH